MKVRKKNYSWRMGRLRVPVNDLQEQKQCEGKRAHLSMGEAMAEARRLLEESDEPIDAYQCSYCFLYYVSHRMSGEKRTTHLKKVQGRQDGYSVCVYEEPAEIGWMPD